VTAATRRIQIVILGLLFALVVASPPVTTFAATALTVSTDRSSYYSGQLLTVSGTVLPVAPRQDVAITVFGPASDLRSVTQVTPSAIGAYSADLMTFGVNDPTGIWSVKATYQGTQAVITLTYLGQPPKPSTISCLVSSSNITIGDRVVISGSIAPARSSVNVNISYSAHGSWIVLATLSSASDGTYSYSTKPASVGSYQFRASWLGDSSYLGATSSIVSVSVNKIATTISCKTSSTDITQGDTITVSGSISPALSGKTVNLTYTKPDGKTTVIRTATTGSDGSYSDSYVPDVTGSWSVTASWNGDSDHQAASSQSPSFNVKQKGCIVATATYGSELSPEVQFLRGFRDNTVLSTFSGTSFMTVFNGFYYSFSPSVASVISANEALRDVMKVLLYPLIAILHLSSVTFSLLSFSPELAVVTAGLVASSLIAIAYALPWVLVFSFIRKFKPSAQTIRLASLVWASSVMGIALAEVVTYSPLMMASTAAFVLATMCLATLVATRAALRSRNKP